MSNEEWDKAVQEKHAQDQYIQRMKSMQNAQAITEGMLGVGAIGGEQATQGVFSQEGMRRYQERLRMEAELRQKQHEYEMRKFEEELKRVADAREYREMIGWLQAAYPEVLGQWHAAKALIRSAEAMDRMGGVANEAVQQGHTGIV